MRLQRYQAQEKVQPGGTGVYQSPAFDLTGVANVAFNAAAVERESALQAEEARAITALKKIKRTTLEEFQTGQLTEYSGQPLDENTIGMVYEDRVAEALTQLSPDVAKRFEPRKTVWMDEFKADLAAAVKEKRAAIGLAEVQTAIDSYAGDAIDAEDEDQVQLELAEMDQLIDTSLYMSETEQRAQKQGARDFIYTNRLDNYLEAGEKLEWLRQWTDGAPVTEETRQKMFDIIDGRGKETRRAQFSEYLEGERQKYLIATPAERSAIEERVEQTFEQARAYYRPEEFVNLRQDTLSRWRVDAAYQDAYEKGGNPETVLENLESYGMAPDDESRMRNSLEDFVLSERARRKAANAEAERERQQKWSDEFSGRLYAIMDRQVEGEAVGEQEWHGFKSRLAWAVERGMDAGSALYYLNMANEGMRESRLANVAAQKFGVIPLTPEEADSQWRVWIQGKDDESQALTDFVAKAGTIPPSMATAVESAVAFGRTDEVAAMASALQAADRLHPGVLAKGLSPEAAAVVSAWKPTMTGEDITAYIKRTKSAEDPTAKARLTALEESQEEMASWLQDSVSAKRRIGNWFTSTPEVEPEMEQEFFDALELRYAYSLDGNLEHAKTLALDDIAQQWNVWEQGGELRWMRQAPTVYFEDPKWVKKKLTQFLKDHGEVDVRENYIPGSAGAITGTAAMPMTVERAPETWLMVDPATIHKPVPDWWVAVKRGNQLEVLRDENNTPYIFGGEDLWADWEDHKGILRQRKTETERAKGEAERAAEARRLESYSKHIMGEAWRY